MKLAKYTCYKKDSSGQWFKMQIVSQCNVMMSFNHQCQGVFQHDGEHWAYTVSGVYQWLDDDHNEGFMSPSEDNYISPVDKLKHHYSSHLDRDWVKVSDRELINRLENEDLTENEEIKEDVNFSELFDDYDDTGVSP